MQQLATGMIKNYLAAVKHYQITGDKDYFDGTAGIRPPRSETHSTGHKKDKTTSCTRYFGETEGDLVASSQLQGLRAAATMCFFGFLRV